MALLIGTRRTLLKVRDDDKTAPTLLSASINGATLTLIFDERVTGYTGLVVFIELVDPDILTQSGTGTSTYVFTLDAPALDGENVTLSYTPGNVADLAGNPLADIAEVAVTNNTTERATSAGDQRVTSAGDIRVTS